MHSSTIIRVVSLAAIAVMLSSPSVFAQSSALPYLDPKLPIEKRIDELLARMSLEQKLGQLRSDLRGDSASVFVSRDGIGNLGPVLRPLKARDAAMRANEIQRLAMARTPFGIPVLIHCEALHGLMANGATSFPQAIGLAAMWNPELMAKVASVIGRETRSRGIRQVLDPVINIARDVRWGRVEETYGEDPFLTSVMGVAYCRSMEAEGVATTPKHFVANIGDGGRDSYPAEMGERELREVHFPPFEVCFKEGNAQSVMSSYNSWNGLPCTADPRLLTTVLRNEWGFKGFAVSDYVSVLEIMNKHHVTANKKETAKRALEAGLDVELPEVNIYGSPLEEGIREGSISMNALDQAVRNVLRVKFNLGLFENPYVEPDQAAKINDAPPHRDLAREAARQAAVLLKNDARTLPLGKTIQSIAVIGPRANEAHLGGYSGYGVKTVSILEGIQKKLGDRVTVRYEKGCEVGFNERPIPSTCLLPAGGRPGERGLRGEYFTNKTLADAPRLVRIDSVISFDWGTGSSDSTIPPDRFSVRWTGKLVPRVAGMYRLGFSSDDGVRLWIDNKLWIDSWYIRSAQLDAVTMPLDSGHTYDIRIEYFESAGGASARLVWALLSDWKERMKPAIDAARRSDVAVVVVGITEGEAHDRANLDLPGDQERLINSVAGTGTPTIVVLVAGSAVTMRSWIDDADAILDVWYPGEEGGNAVADVLLGDVNPGGRLPVTFPRFVGQVPLYYNHKPTGRGNDYTDMSGRPQFPFGFGLSYTSFEYSDIGISPAVINADDTAQVTCRVKNIGDRAGDEVVQLYLRDPVASVTRPVKELKGFQRLSLKAGEERLVSFRIDRSHIRFLDINLRPVVEPGEVEVMIGSSSDDIRLSGLLMIGR